MPVGVLADAGVVPVRGVVVVVDGVLRADLEPEQAVRIKTGSKTNKKCFIIGLIQIYVRKSCRKDAGFVDNAINLSMRTIPCLRVFSVPAGFNPQHLVEEEALIAFQRRLQHCRQCCKVGSIVVHAGRYAKYFAARGNKNPVFGQTVYERIAVYGIGEL